MNMNLRAAIVTRLPSISAKKAPEFVRQLCENTTEIVRPNIVLDLSSLNRFDAGVLDLLLCCLEEALKRNGDVRLAALHPDVKAMLDAAGAGRLFRIYATVEEGVASFRRLDIGATQPNEIPPQAVLPPARAA
jgi:anti-anti-sigma factor